MDLTATDDTVLQEAAGAIEAALRDAKIPRGMARRHSRSILSLVHRNAETYASVAGVDTQAFQDLLKDEPLKALASFIAGLGRRDVVGRWQIISPIPDEGLKSCLLQLLPGVCGPRRLWR